jgi:hypothetical protein
MNKKDAAQYLGISTRALEYHVTQGNIGRRMVKGKTGDVADFDAGELRRLKARLDDARAPRATVERDESSEAEPRSLARLSDIAPLVAVLERLKVAPAGTHPGPPTISDLAHKIYLTEREAARYSGLPLAAIRGAREKLKTAKHGGRAYLVKRAALEEWAAKLRA